MRQMGAEHQAKRFTGAVDRLFEQQLPPVLRKC